MIGTKKPIQPRFTSGESASLERAGIMLLGSAIGGVLVLINEALIARFLGIEVYGFYALAAMFTRVGSILSSFGIPLAVLHFLPINLTQRDYPRALGTVLGSLILPALLGLTFALSIWFSSDWFANTVFGQPRAAMMIRGLVLAVPVLAMSEVLGFLGRAFGSARTYVLVRNFGAPICYFVVILYLLNTAAPSVSITTGLVSANCAAFFISAGCILFLTRKLIGWGKPVLCLKSIITYSAPISFNIIAYLIIVWTDLFLLGIYSTAKVVGQYRACVQFVIPFELILTASSSSMAPVYSVLIHEGLLDRLRESYLSAIHLVTLLAVPLFILLLLNGKDFLGILGPEFSVGATGLWILAFGQMVRAYSGNAAVVLTMGNKQSLEAWNGTIAAICNVVANAFLIPRFGLLGAAAGTSASLFVLSCLRIAQVWRAFAMRTFDKGQARLVLITAISAILSYWVSVTVGFGAGTGLTHMIVRFVLMSTTIAISIWAFCLSKAERSLLLEIAGVRKQSRILHLS